MWKIRITQLQNYKVEMEFVTFDSLHSDYFIKCSFHCKRLKSDFKKRVCFKIYSGVEEVRETTKFLIETFGSLHTMMIKLPTLTDVYNSHPISMRLLPQSS